MSDVIATIAHWTACTEAEGPGRRFALWFQGCPMRCPGCCNPEMLSFDGGQSVSVQDLVTLVLAAKAEHQIEGITLLGGEPLAHAQAAAALARELKPHGLSVMIFSGYTLDEATALPNPEVSDLLALTDILVDGRYDRNLPDNSRRGIGSTNQQIHFLSERYRADDPCWKKKNTIEIRLDRTGLTVNGFPATSAVGLWKDLPRRQQR